jgi:hypothetical protein
MPTLHEEIFEKVQTLAPDSPTAKRLAALMRGEATVEPAAAAAPATTNGGFSIEGATPDDAWNMTSAIKPTQDRHLTEQAVPVGLPPSAPSAPEVFSVENAAPDDLPSLSAEAPEPVASGQAALSISEQFQAYTESGQWAQAEQWLGTVVSAQPADPHPRELLGQVLERKGDGAGAALQYARALELMSAGQDSVVNDPIRHLYDKVKELAPASPIVAKLSATMAPAAPADEVDAETHYTLGVAYKNMGLIEEAKEEFAFAMKGPEVFLDACLMTAVCLKEQERYDSASAQLERLLTDPRCQGAKAQAIRYELGLLYEQQQQWQLAATMFEAIPAFHDVPQRLAHIRTVPKPASASAQAFRYAT